MALDPDREPARLREQKRSTPEVAAAWFIVALLFVAAASLAAWVFLIRWIANY